MYFNFTFDFGFVQKLCYEYIDFKEFLVDYATYYMVHERATVLLVNQNAVITDENSWLELQC